ncbi:MAG: tyrosine-type recombinase/integrase [Candidatus Thermoplasmatota archaeon]|nr:tyrosine-type recombinase/integrase [Candidatus Thermoplasmatota archaeon]
MAGITNKELVEKYIKHCKRQGRTKKTIENYTSALSIFQGFLKTKKVSFLSVDGMESKEILEDFLDYLRDQRKVSFARIKVYFSALSHFYDFLAYNGYIKNNIVLTVRKMYVQEFKNGYVPAKRKIIEIDEMSTFVNSIMNLRDKAIVVLFVKTGIRRGELISIDVDEIDFQENTIQLKSIFKKRSRLTVFFDDECAAVLKQWLKRREYMVAKGEKALFISDFGHRLQRRGVYDAVVKWAEYNGFHNGSSDLLKDHFTPHNLRHCFTTYLRRAGVPKSYVQELRGDKRGDVIDIYHHIYDDELKKAYLAAIPKLNII